ncbi:MULTISPECIES: hypothetical protein [unclassified Leptolyngbya]|uniref:hypothetical protein n=1 Tax=unclassified Leptolyngbya TaxID=2650499 RepID=UPI0016824609|nr:MULTISPECIES: hypothetical protein [unclassified Leptolyngbya]MBD1912728.1 hypothetical protein [Leptolyngbya sp. FACHB-8]MBD2154649.1 hypothetical protein [Leptolyngbya sp. FACHB-16]
MPKTKFDLFIHGLRMGMAVGLLNGMAGVAIAGSSQCSNDLATLMPALLDALPSYANRVIQRSRLSERQDDISGYILLTSAPDFDPLPLEGEGPDSADSLDGDVQQVFFTTLERQYGISGFRRIQAHHWLFMVPTQQGWQLALMQTSIENYPSSYLPPEPPRDSSNGVVAQAIRLWLRDCQAGALVVDR